MDSRMRTISPHGLNKGFELNFLDAYYDRHLKKAGEYIDQNIMIIPTKMRTLVQTVQYDKINCIRIYNMQQDKKIYVIQLINTNHELFRYEKSRIYISLYKLMSNFICK